MNCTKAIIPIAGFGTRRLPVTKTIEKSMLPILNRPMIDYVVQDCIKAGVTDLYFVVSPGATQIKEYYEHNEVLEDYLRTQGKGALLPLIEPPKVRFHYIEQDTGETQAYGTAVPVWLCRDVVQEGEHVLIITGDDVVYNPDGASEAKRLIDLVAEKGTAGALLGARVPKNTVSHYGVIETSSQDGYDQFVGIQEKPSLEEAKSNLINISKYIVTRDFFTCLDAYMDTDRTGEYYLTDVLNAYVADGNVMAVLPARGEYLDSGTVENWLKANEVVAKYELGI
jgi:UTP--glucose-1-phosphate uridylyltransferase